MINDHVITGYFIQLGTTVASKIDVFLEKVQIEDFFGRTECYQNSPPHMLKTLHSMYIYQNAIVVFLETMIAE